MPTSNRSRQKHSRNTIKDFRKKKETQAYQTIRLKITTGHVNDEKKTRLNRFPKLPTRLSVRNEIGD